MFIKCVLFTDEACFSLARTFKLHNFFDWQQDNPHVVHRSNYQHQFSIGIGIVGNYPIGPYLRPSLSGDILKRV